MKLTPVLEEALQELKENTVLHKMRHIYGSPHRFGPVALAYRHPQDGKINGRSIWGFPNTQSLNRLVLLGYAEYQDKAKTIIKYIDKDAAEAELKRKAAIYDRMMSLREGALFEDRTHLDPLALQEDDFQQFDIEEMQLLYDNLVSMVYKALAEIEELEKEYESLQNHIENIRWRI